MNDEDNTSEAPEGAIPTDRRPLGFWLRTVDHLISRAFAQALAAEDVNRRDWMLLNALSGAVDVPGFADKLARRSRRLDDFIERGWVAETGSGWELTDEGRAAHERLADIVQGLRERVAGAVSPDEFATMTASLESIARELGWDENARMPRGRGRGFGRGFGSGFGWGFGPGAWGFGPGAGGWGDEGSEESGEEGRSYGRGYGSGRGYGPFGRGFGPGFDPRRGFGWGFGPAFGHHGHGGHHDHGGHHGHHGHPHHGHGEKSGRGKGERRTERAYERGFSAGFDAAQRGERPQPAASDTSV